MSLDNLPSRPARAARQFNQYPEDPDAIQEMELVRYNFRNQDQRPAIEEDNVVPVSLTRPNSSNGYWLSMLLPMAFFSYNVRVLIREKFEFDNSNKSDIYKQYDLNWEYRLLTTAAINMFLATVWTLILMNNEQIARWKNIAIYCISSIAASVLYYVLVPNAIYYCVPLAMLITFVYKMTYVRVLNCFKACFTYGEACIIVQGILLFVLNTLVKSPKLFTAATLDEQVVAVISMGLLYLLIFYIILYYVDMARQPKYFYTLYMLQLLASSCIPISKRVPVVILFEYITIQNRPWAVGGFVMVSALIIFCMYLMMSFNMREYIANLHKIYVLFILYVYIQGFFTQCSLIYFFSTWLLILFILLETLRKLQIPPLGAMLNRAMQQFANPRDGDGSFMITPFTYIIACAMPLWITEPACVEDGRKNGISDHLLIPCGFITVAIADTLACVVGSSLEDIFTWPNFNDTRRTLLGSIVYFVSVFIGLSLMDILHFDYVDYIEFLIVAIITTIVEHRIDQIDNLVLPLVSFIVLCYRVPLDKFKEGYNAKE